MPTIALIDEDEDRLADLSNTLEAEGYRIATYSNGAAAIDGFRASPPDVVILDIAMPRMDGVETLRVLREKSDIPIVLLPFSEQEIKGTISSQKSDQRLLHAREGELRLLMQRIREILKRARAAGAKRRQEEFTPSESLVSMFHDGLSAQYEILREGNSDELRKAPSLEYARAVLSGRLLEVIASRARRMQYGVLENKVLCNGGVFEYGFVQELSEHLSFRIDRGTEFFAQLRKDLVDHLRQGGSIAGRWGRLALADDNIAIETNRIGRPRNRSIRS
jgi:CheY-like chemotaxis protein